MAYPSPGAVGPPVDYPRPPGSFNLGHYLTQRVTQPGDSITNVNDWLSALTHPRAALAAGLRSPVGQAATILVPGARGGGGRPTIPQQSLLDAIFTSSWGVPERLAQQMGTRVGPGGVGRSPYEISDPFVQALAKQIGKPYPAKGAQHSVRAGVEYAENPRNVIPANVGGETPDYYVPGQVPELRGRLGSSNVHLFDQNLVDKIVNEISRTRRN